MKSPKKKASKKKKARKKRVADAEKSVVRVTRHVKDRVTAMLWGLAAGRCQFAGCNRPVWKSPITQETVNIAEKAHIYAFSSDGPRGNAGISKKDLNDLGNLLLVCHDCHKKIDKKKDGGRYSVELLRRWKASHEQRVEMVTGIASSKTSHVVLYGANIGDQSSPVNFSETAHALFPLRYPADRRPIELGMVNSSLKDRDGEFWEVESRNLRRHFDQRIRERQADGKVGHLSVFALAPQPLLMTLGTMLTDVPDVDVYQRHREPTQTWAWPENVDFPGYVVAKPASTADTPALVLALSAEVSPDRITSVLGDNVAIWTVTIRSPNNDHMKSREQLSQFRTVIRGLFDEIKAVHGQTTTLHVFPAVSVSEAVECGRVHMPKAHMPLKIYDQVNDLDGFVEAVEIS